jgi:hypothetical protein
MYLLTGDSDRAAQVATELQRLGDQGTPPSKRRAKRQAPTR